MHGVERSQRNAATAASDDHGSSVGDACFVDAERRGEVAAAVHLCLLSGQWTLDGWLEWT